MRTFNDEYQTSAYAKAKEPRFTIRIDFASDFTDPVYVLSHADAAYPGGATVISSRIISGSVVSQELKPISTIGNINFTCLDNSDSLTDLLYDKLQADKGVRLKRVRVYKGFRGLDWSAYELYATQVIGKLTYKNNIYKVSCQDVQRLAKDKKLFIPKETNLLQTLSATETSKIYVYDNSEFQTTYQGTSYSDSPNSNVFYVKIDEEVIRCSGTGNDGNDFLTIDARGRFNTLAVEHEIKSGSQADSQPVVKEYVYIEMPVVKLLYALLLGAIYGSSPESTFPEHRHLNLDTEYLENADLTGIGDDIWDTSDDTAGVQCRFTGIEEISGKEFIEEELLPLIGCWMPVYSDGALGLKRRPAVTSQYPTDTEFNNSNIMTYSDLTYDFSELANQIKVYWNWSEYRQDYTRTTEIAYSDSITKHQTSDKKIIKFRGLHASKYSDEVVANIIDMLADRQTYPQWLLDLTLLPSLDGVENGDVVRVNTNHIKDFTQSPANLDRSFEIVKLQTDLLTGVVSCKLRCSSENIQPYTSFTTSTVLPDAWYTSQGGTNINTLSGYSAGALTSNITLTGSTFPAGAIYYHDGDLTINSGVTITFTQNVSLYIKGELIINGILSGTTQGLSGQTGGFDQQSPVNKFPVAIGHSVSNGGFGDAYYINTVSPGTAAWARSVLKPITGASCGSSTSVKKLQSLNIYYDGTNLVGLPLELRGAPGPAGTGIRGNGTTVKGGTGGLANGGDGGNSGAGALVVSRGVSFGASGSIVSNGGNATQGGFFEGAVAESPYNPVNPIRIGAGNAGPGMPGGLCFVLDGQTSTIPDLDKITLNSGTSTDDSNDGAYLNYNWPTYFLDYSWTDPGYILSRSNYQGWSFKYLPSKSAGSISGLDYKLAHTKITFLKDQVDAEEDPAETKPTAPTSLNITSDETVLLTLQDGTQIVRAYLSWTASTDRTVDGYYVYYRNASESPIPEYKRYGDRIISRSDAEIYIGPLEQGSSYDFRVTAVNIFGNESDYLTSTGHVIVGKSNNPNVPTSISLTSTTTGIVIAGTAPSDKDLAAISIESSASVSPLSYSEIARVGVVPGGKWAFTHELAAGTVQYYRVRSVDTSGLFSAYVSTSPNSETAGYVSLSTDITGDADDISEGTTNKFASESGADVTLDQAIEVGFRDWFDEFKDWTNYAGSGETSIVSVTDSQMGGAVLRVGNNSGNDQAWLIHDKNIPFDPLKLYTLKIRIRRTAGTGVIYAGWAGVAADGTTWVNRTGISTVGSQHYHCKNSGAPSSSPVSTWTEYTGYTKGYGSTEGTGMTGTLTSPGVMHPDVRYIRPLILVNHNSVAGTTEIDSYVCEIGADATQQVMDDGLLTTGYLAVKNSTFGNAGAQLRYNSTEGTGEFYVGDGQERYLKVYQDTSVSPHEYIAEVGRDARFKGASSYEQDAIYVDDFLSRVSTWNVSGTYQEPGGSITLRSTGGAAASLTKYYIRELTNTTWTKDRRFKTKIAISGTNLSTTTAQVHTGLIDVSQYGFGFEYSSSTFYAVSVAGGSRTTTDTGLTISSGTEYKLEAIKTGSTIYFYVNDALEATHTTGVPTTGTTNSSPLGRYYIRNTGAANQDLSFAHFKLIQEE